MTATDFQAATVQIAEIRAIPREGDDAASKAPKTP